MFIALSTVKKNKDILKKHMVFRQKSNYHDVLNINMFFCLFLFLFFVFDKTIELAEHKKAMK